MELITRVFSDFEMYSLDADEFQSNMLENA